jgi:hypothetical protein
MPGVVATTAAGGSASVAPVRNASNPTASSAANAIAASAGRVTANPDNFEVSWREFNTFAEAKAYASHVKLPKTDEEGYYLSSTTKKSSRLSYGDVRSMQGGKKTAGFGNAAKLEVGKSTNTMYVCYKNLHDRNSVVFVVGKLTRIAYTQKPKKTKKVKTPAWSRVFPLGFIRTNSSKWICES